MGLTIPSAKILADLAALRCNLWSGYIPPDAHHTIALAEAELTRSHVERSPALELAVQQAIIDWSRAHTPPPLNIDKHQEGGLTMAVLRAICAVSATAKTEPDEKCSHAKPASAFNFEEIEDWHETIRDSSESRNRE